MRHRFARFFNPLNTTNAFGCKPSARGVFLPFTFRFLPFALRAALRFLLLAFCFCSCKFNPDLQGRGEATLQGEWQQDSTALQKKMLTYTMYKLRISCDSFFLSINYRTRANTGVDTCVKNGNWAEYAKGVYEQKSDTLHLAGLFCNADMSYKNEGGCFRSGKYQEVFKLKKVADTVIQFNPLSSVLPFTARRIKRTDCIPKPL